MRVDGRVRTGLTATGEAIVGRMSLQREFDFEDEELSAKAAASSREDRMR
jgi:hypothetical protein